MNCKNCSTELNKGDGYCRNCGGKIIRKRLSFKNLFEHLSEIFFNYDNKLLRTFIQLIKTPEEVIASYINGVRKKYVNPISFFGFTLTIIGLEWLILRRFFPHLLNLSSIAIQGNEAGLNTVFNFVQKNSSLIMMLSVPLYALISRIVFFDTKKYNYIEHIIAFIYMLALLSIFGAILNIIGVCFGFDVGAMAYINLPAQIIYISFCFKRLYGIKILDISTRALLSLIVYMVFYIIILIIIFFTIYFIEGKESVISLFKNFKPS